MDAFRSILLPVSEVEGLVDRHRRAGDWSWGHGVPAHLTLAGPFPVSAALPREALGAAAAEIRGTRFVLSSVGWLGAALCLFPDDDTELPAWGDRVLRVIGEPDGVDASWRPHLTVCRPDATAADADEITRTLERSLPVTCAAGPLLVAEMDASGRVRVESLG